MQNNNRDTGKLSRTITETYIGKLCRTKTETLVNYSEP